MTTFSAADDLQGAQFVDTNLRGARFVRAGLGGVVMRGVDVTGVDIDAPWLIESGGSFLVNGVNVTPFVDAELDRRFPGRSQRRAEDPDGLRSAWLALERTWVATIERAGAMPAGTVDVSVDGECSFSQTLRHQVMAIDTWLRGAVLGVEQPYHRLGQPHTGYTVDGHDASVFAAEIPDFADVLEVWADRRAMVTEFLAAVTPEVLAESRASPWEPESQETVLACVHTILEEGWEHHRYAVRDLDTIAAPGG